MHCYGTLPDKVVSALEVPWIDSNDQIYHVVQELWPNDVSENVFGVMIVDSLDFLESCWQEMFHISFFFRKTRLQRARKPTLIFYSEIERMAMWLSLRIGKMPRSGDANILVGKGSVASSPQHVCSILFPKQLIFKSLPLPSNEPNRNSDLAIALPSCCVITGGVNFVTLTKPYRRAFMRSKPRDCLRLFTDFLRAFTTLSKHHHGQLKFFNIPHSPTIQHTSFSLRNIGLEHRRIKVV